MKSSVYIVGNSRGLEDTRNINVRLLTSERDKQSLLVEFMLQCRSFYVPELSHKEPPGGTMVLSNPNANTSSSAAD
jgi:hypothetical protein